MFDPIATLTSLQQARETLALAGRPLEWLLVAGALALISCALVPRLRPRLGLVIALHTTLLGVGEVLLALFHTHLYQVATVWDPMSRTSLGGVAVPLWISSEKLYVWALALVIATLAAKRHADEIRPLAAVAVALVTLGAVVWSRPFTAPLPDFFAQYEGYLRALLSGVPQEALAAFQGMAGARRYYYNTWYMWVHPPLLFASYGAFVMSFLATVLAYRHRRASFEETAYRWARLGYLPLTTGMLIGFPWAVMAWAGESWWWSGKVNMSIMMWLLYTAYLHGRLHLRQRGTWRLALALSALSFAALVLTYVTTYVVPGAHSVAG